MWSALVRIGGVILQGALGWVIGDVFNTTQETEQQRQTKKDDLSTGNVGGYLKRGINWTAVIIAGVVSLVVGYLINKFIKK